MPMRSLAPQAGLGHTISSGRMGGRVYLLILLKYPMRPAVSSPPPRYSVVLPPAFLPLNKHQANENVGNSPGSNCCHTSACLHTPLQHACIARPSDGSVDGSVDGWRIN